VLGQFVAALRAEQLVLATVGLGGLFQDLAGNLPEVAVGIDRRVGRQLGPIDGHHPDRRQSRPGAQAEHAAKDVAQRSLVAAAELGDRRVIGHQVGRDHAIRDVLHARALDPARRPVPTRIRVQQQRDHHRRLIRRTTVTILAIVGVEQRQVQLADRPQHRPDQMLLRHPIGHRRRQKKRLLTISPDEPRAHTPKTPGRPGQHAPFPDSLDELRQRPPSQLPRPVNVRGCYLGSGTQQPKSVMPGVNSPSTAPSSVVVTGPDGSLMLSVDHLPRRSIDTVTVS
jgi:hypothetical protein